MRKRAVLVDYAIYDQYPLGLGNLHAYSCTDDAVRDSYQFLYHNRQVAAISSYDDEFAKLVKLEADVYCLSSYVWNMGLVKRLAHDLAQIPTTECVVLGGHQVSGQIARYIPPEQDKIIVVNGEGEAPFRALLKTLVQQGDRSQIPGISCYIDGELHDGGIGPKISALETIPSPFLSGLFDDFSHPITVFETNRGCPYKCSFCTWGGPTVQVTKFPLERVLEELAWIAKRGVLFIYLADANWGMLKRDVEISEYIGKLKEKHGSPWGVYYAAAKNKPKGSMACIETFHRAGVITSQALGIQSLNDDTLEAIDRKNIRNESFMEMFRGLEEGGVSSFCELIWPLPKETLDTLKLSFQKLVALGAQTTILYPTLLINNAKLTDDAVRYGFSTHDARDWRSELKLVKATDVASAEDVEQGFWFYYSFFLMGNCDGFKALFRFAEDMLGVSLIELVTQFSEYLQRAGKESAYYRFLLPIFEKEEQGDLLTIGRIATHLTHEHRSESQRLLASFLADSFEDVPLLRMAFIPMLLAAMPRLFQDTGFVEDDVLSTVQVPGVPPFSEVLDLRSTEKLTLEIRAYREAFCKALSYFDVEMNGSGERLIEFANRSNDLVRMPHAGGGGERTYVYAHGMIQRLVDVRPAISCC